MNTGYGNNMGSTNAGPHSSNMANKLDPRVDSDMDGSRNAGMAGNTGTGMAGNTGYGNNMGSTNAGPHPSNVANKLDPRVDSDRDGSRNAGFAGNTGTTGMTGQHRAQGTGAMGTTTTGTTTAGPHNSNLLNKVDPRVDSDADGRTNMGLAAYGPGGANSAASGPAAGTAGPHRSNVANKVDPTVDSDADGKRNMGMAAHGPGGHHHHNQPQHHHGHHTGAAAGATAGVLMGGGMGGPNSTSTGPAPHTAGPHKLDILNKLDPRVDSNMDGSATIGNTGSTAPVHNTGNVHGSNKPLV